MIEFKEMTKFRETPVARQNFDRWFPVGTRVRIKSGCFAGHAGVVLHQTTRHRYHMMIRLQGVDTDVLCGRKEIEVIDEKG